MNSTQLMGVVRDVIKVIGVFVVAFGYVDESTWEMVTGAAVTAAASLWSWYTNMTTTMIAAVADSTDVKKVVVANAALANAFKSEKVKAS